MNRSALGFGTTFVLLGILGVVNELTQWSLEIELVLPAVLIIAGIVLTVTSLLPKETR